MENLICQECHLSFNSLKSLHLHLRQHKISQAYYYQKHFPRFDKFNGSMIKFKNLDFYLNNDFNCRENSIRWLKSVSKQEAKEYILNFLVTRKRKKELKFFPSQVELKSLPIAGIKLINDIWEDYRTVADMTELFIRFPLQNFSGTWKKFHKKHKIIIDTREQKPLSFSIPTLIDTIPFGDYILNDMKFSHNCYVERKSLGDFYSTMSMGIERFIKEIEKAQHDYLIVIIEEPMEEVYQFTQRYQVAGKTRISPEFVLHNMRDIMQKYNYVQFLFVKNRIEAARIIERIFCSNGQYKQIDLQFQYDVNGFDSIEK